jgi:AbrB family looped-hinge helix DNA binding protein
MDITVSTKYQIVIPKAVRKQLGIKPGQKLRIDSVVGKQVTLSAPLTTEEYLDKYADSLKGTVWQKSGMDATEWIRKMRDED